MNVRVIYKADGTIDMELLKYKINAARPVEFDKPIDKVLEEKGIKVGDPLPADLEARIALLNWAYDGVAYQCWNDIEKDKVVGYLTTLGIDYVVETINYTSEQIERWNEIRYKQMSAVKANSYIMTGV
jgi:hypothetical protein